INFLRIYVCDNDFSPFLDEHAERLIADCPQALQRDLAPLEFICTPDALRTSLGCCHRSERGSGSDIPGSPAMFGQCYDVIGLTENNFHVSQGCAHIFASDVLAAQLINEPSKGS